MSLKDFSKESNATPELRFPEFDGTWRQHKLQEITTFSKGKGISKNDIAKHGKTKCIRYGELYTTYGEIINCVFSKTNLPITSLVLSDVNDIIIPSSGETQIDIATASCILQKGVAIGGDLNILKTEENGVFLSYYLNNEKRIAIARLSQGISVVHLYASQLAELKINLPSLQEQNKIAAFLSKVDEKIEKQQSLIEQLEQLKKGYLQQIFSQELRFPEFDDMWEEKRLGEIARRVLRKNIENNQNVMTISAQEGLVAQGDYFTKSVSAKNITGYYLLKYGEFAYNKSYSNGYPLGAIKRLKNYQTGVVSTLYICFKLENNYSEEYVDHYFSSGKHNHELHKIAQEGARNHGLLNISIGDFFNICIFHPSLPEQTKIANFLSAVDKKIETVKQQLEATQTLKKGLLQNMFV